MRIDAHQHFWRYTSAEYGWIDDTMQPLRRDFLPREYEAVLASSGIEGSIAVQARQTLAETSWLLQFANRHPWIVGVVGWVDLCSPLCAHQLDSFAKEPRLCGIRHVLQDEPAEFTTRPEFRRGLAELQRRRLVYDVLIRPAQADAALQLCRAYPELTFVLDHLGKPDVRRGAIEAWRQNLQLFGALPNVHCKLSGLATEADWQAWKPAQLRPYADEVLNAFGPGRVLFGSDWPVCTLAVEYERWRDLVEDWVAHLGAEDRRAVFGGNAARTYRVGGATAALR